MWTQANELAALVVEKVEERLYTLIAMQAKHRDKVPKPIVIAHPQRPVPAPRKKKPVRDPALIARALAGGKP